MLKEQNSIEIAKLDNGIAKLSLNSVGKVSTIARRLGQGQLAVNFVKIDLIRLRFGLTQPKFGLTQ